MQPPYDFIRSPQGAVTDVVVERGLSLHFFDAGVGIYSSRIHCGKGYAQLTKRDVMLLVEFFLHGDNLALLTSGGATPGGQDGATAEKS